jgi:hypothetical protein
MDHRIELCKTCSNRHFDQSQGIICGLTMAKPGFTNTCETFKKDENVTEAETEPISAIDQKAIKKMPSEFVEKLKAEQSIPVAIAAGAAAALIGAALWATITVITKYQIGFMALAAGALIGIAVRYFGKGIDRVFGVIGGVFALLGCMLGNFFGEVAFASIQYDIDFFEILMKIDLMTLVDVMVKTFSMMDVFFYGIAVYEGYQFSFRIVKPEEIEALSGKVKS